MRRSFKPEAQAKEGAVSFAGASGFQAVAPASLIDVEQREQHFAEVAVVLSKGHANVGRFDRAVAARQELGDNPLGKFQGGFGMHERRQTQLLVGGHEQTGAALAAKDRNPPPPPPGDPFVTVENELGVLMQRQFREDRKCARGSEAFRPVAAVRRRGTRPRRRGRRPPSC